MSKRPKGWEKRVHPHHVAAVHALKGKVKLGTKARPAMSNRTIATLLNLDMKTVKKILTNEPYRETVLARKEPLAPPKEFLESPILAELAELREALRDLQPRVKALEPPAPAEPEPEATEAINDDGGEGKGTTTGDGDKSPPDGPGDPPGGSGGPGEPEPEAAEEFFPLGGK